MTEGEKRLSEALAEHDRRQLAALEGGQPINGGNKSKTDDFLVQYRAKLAELKAEGKE